MERKSKLDQLKDLKSWTVMARKRPHRFSCNDDIILLKEVIAVNPFQYANPKLRWDEIAANLNPYFNVDGRRCRERTNLILAYFLKGDIVSLRRSGTEEEYKDREKLLLAVKDLRDLDDIYPSLLLQQQQHRRPRVDQDPHPDGGGSPMISMTMQSPTTSAITDSDVEQDSVDGIGNSAKKQKFNTSSSNFPRCLHSHNKTSVKVRLMELNLRQQELDLQKERLRLDEQRYHDELDLRREKLRIEEQKLELERQRMEADKNERVLMLDLIKMMFEKATKKMEMP